VSQCNDTYVAFGGGEAIVVVIVFCEVGSSTVRSRSLDVGFAAKFEQPSRDSNS